MSRGLGRWSEISRFIRPEEWQLSPFLDGLLGNDLGADFGVGGEDAVIPQHVKSRRRDERGETSDEVQGLEQDGFGAVFPPLLEAVSQTTIAMLFEALERERGTSDVTANALESISIATIDGDSSVDIYAVEFDMGTIRVGRDEMECATEFARTLPSTLTDEHEVCGGCTRARGKHRLFIREHVFIRAIE